MSLMEVLNIRTDFEKITEGYSMPKGSDINNVEWFIVNGHKSNRLRDGFNDAIECAQKIKELTYGGRGNKESRLSSCRY
jgi:hypothetical protein